MKGLLSLHRCLLIQLLWVFHTYVMYMCMCACVCAHFLRFSVRPVVDYLWWVRSVDMQAELNLFFSPGCFRRMCVYSQAVFLRRMGGRSCPTPHTREAISLGDFSILDIHFRPRPAFICSHISHQKRCLLTSIPRNISNARWDQGKVFNQLKTREGWLQSWTV